MDASLALSYLPQSLAFHKSLEPFKEAKDPPSLSTIIQALGKCEDLDLKSVLKEIDEALRRAENLHQTRSIEKIRVVDFWSHHYPHSLRLIKRPPWNLFYMGELPSSIPTISIVGSRHPNEYGIKVLTQVIPWIQTRPIQIISGLAFGVDAIAHSIACSLQISNFAVLGCGLDQIYPTQNTALAHKIIQTGGGILSEFPPETSPLPHHFPQRNRIISGLSEIVWIVQGTIKSGSVHTVRHALQQNKTVAATPGDIFLELSSLPNRLLYDGAQMILNAEDIDLLLGQTQSSPTRMTH